MANDCPPDTASTPEEKGLPGRWKIELVGGHKFDLADLSEAAPGVGAKVLQGGDKWFLHASSFRLCMFPDTVSVRR